ncbi:MAG: HIRAN domain-containing protein [Erysipelotrichaceae bacterium]|nr:HIRAN domain-containing protein [Erysipelotrichaceae bacterium]
MKLVELLKSSVDTSVAKQASFNPDEFVIEVISFSDEHVETIKRMLEEGKRYFTCKFENEPNNEHDPNAIKVMIRNSEKEWICAGYVPIDKQHDVHMALNFLRKNKYYTSLQFDFSYIKGSCMTVCLRKSSY